MERIVIRGATEHNLKGIDVDIPHRRMTVVCGVSGSGKSTLAFDILYAEGQRRYIESLSTYAKQFLERIARPEVDDIVGICPSIAIEQKNPTRSSRSTIGTATEIYDYLRLLYARVGKTFCPDCNRAVVSYSADEVIDELVSNYPGRRFLIVAPIPVESTRPEETLSRLLSEGYTRILVEGNVLRLDPLPERIPDLGSAIHLVLDRVTVSDEARSRLLESVETSYSRAGGQVAFLDPDSGVTLTYTSLLKCSGCGRSFEEPRPLLFSFNTPYGACPFCRGFGNRMEFDERLIVPDPRRSLREYAIEPWSSERMGYWHEKLIRYCRKRRIPLDKPFYRLDEADRRVILEGDEEFPGVIPFLEEMREKSYKRYARFFTRRYLAFRECRHCKGGRLREEAYFVRVGGKDIREVARMTPGEALAFVEGLELTEREGAIAKDVLLEARSRLRFLVDVGLHYVTLDRLTRTLSGGEAQRISLANSLGANLVGILYVLDEPSIGLHPRDTGRLIEVLLKLRDRGNTVVVVEHDLDMIRSADYLIDLGPGAGREGGEVLYQGALGKARSRRSHTIRYLKRGLPLPRALPRKKRFEDRLELRGVSEHNLKSIDVSIPLGAFVVVTGVSGSGKSTLVCDVLYNALKTDLPGYVHSYREIIGREKVRKVMMVDQSPIGKTPRSNPITFIKAFAFIRDIFASQREAMRRGYRSGRFSFNVPGGRCNRCQGMGYERIEMHFMADLFIPCQECEGKRFNPETLEIEYRGRNLADVLEMTVDEAYELFRDHRPLALRLGVLRRVGLGYLELGQSSTTLSGGESQRLKIARELVEGNGGGNLYILDEPTTGLHIKDIEILLPVLEDLVAGGNTVIVIEHNPQVIVRADYIIDLGPEGGDDGGEVVATGSPAEIAACKGSHTGAYLRKLLRNRGPRKR